MKKSHLGIVGAAYLLAACGGGGGGSSIPPTPGPTPTPKQTPVSFSTSWDWIGTMHIHKAVQAGLRIKQTTGSATPEPIQIAVQPCNNNPGAQNCGSTTFQSSIGQNSAQVIAEVSPAPSPNVIPTWAPLPANLSAPSPEPSSSPGVLNIDSQMIPGAFTLSGTVPIPGAPQTVTPNGYVFPAVALGDPSFFPATNIGYSFSGDVATATSNTSLADIYVSTNGTTPSLNFPGGAQIYSLNNLSLVDIGTASWSNAMTSIDFPTLQSDLNFPNNDNMFQLQTHAGNLVRIFVYQVQIQGANGALFLSFDQSGSSLTGSY